MLKGDNMIFVDPSLGSFSGMITVPTTFSMDYRRQIKKVIFNDPATIIFWKDGSKTVVKCQPDDKYDKMTGFAMACAKYMFGNEGNYYEVFKKWVGEAAPTADVRENVKGQWLDYQDNPIKFYFDGRYSAHCSVCGYHPEYEEEMHSANFCPNCGADMRGDKA